MDQLERIIQHIQTPEDYQQKFQLILQIILEQEGTNTSRPETIRLLETIDRIITSNSEIQHKFYAIMITKDLFSKQYSQFISSLSNSKLLQSMLFIALNTDPNRRIEDKGRALYGQQGNDYIVLILECLVKWSERYPENTRRGAPTKFRLIHQELIKERIILPKEFRFFDHGSNKVNTINNSSNINEDKRSNQFNMGNSSELNQNISTRAIQLAIKNSIIKIEGFFNFLDETDDVQKLRLEIDRYHRLFEQEYNKNQLQIDKILNEKLLDEESTNHFLGIQQFYHSQKEAYNRFLRNSDELKQYIDTIAISTQQIRDKILKKSNRMQRQKERQSITQSNYGANSSKFPPYPSFSNEKGQEQYQRIIYQKRTTDVVNTNTIPNPGRNSYGRVEQAYFRNQYPQQSTINMKNYPPKRQTEPINYGSYVGDSHLNQNHRSVGNNPQGYVVNVNQYDQGQSVRTSGYYKDKELNMEAEKGHILIKEMMSKVTVREGFSKIKKQLDEQRSLSNRSRNPNRTRRSKSPRPMSRYRKFQQQSHFSHSRDVSRLDPLEINPMKVTRNDYAGSLLYPFDYDFSDMSKDQGWKKYRKANFKSKGILFQNQHIQIGYKSQAIYEELGQFHNFIKIGIYVGNKINDTLTRIEVDYEGDETSITYLNPKRMEQTINKGQQIKQDIIIIPRHFPFHPISCVFQYSIKRQSHTIVLYLPNTILKLTKNLSIPAQKFNQYYQLYKSNEYRSPIFKLSKDKQCHHSHLQKLFQNNYSVKLTNYDTFLNHKTQSQYILGFYFEVMEIENYLCKLIVRQDLTAIVQLVAIQNADDAEVYGKMLVQTLQMLLESREEHQ